MHIKVKTAIYRYAQELQIFYTHFVATGHTFVPNAHRLIIFHVSQEEVESYQLVARVALSWSLASTVHTSCPFS